MRIREALRRQSDLASHSRGKEPNSWFCGSNAIVVMLAILLAIICLIQNILV